LSEWSPRTSRSQSVVFAAAADSRRLLGGEHQRLHRSLERQAEEGGHVLAGRLAGRRRLLQRLGGGAPRRGRGQRLGHLDVGSVVRLRRVDDRVLAVAAITWNSCERMPPIEPLSAATGRNVSPCA
jgi:hypothetical protein